MRYVYSVVRYVPNPASGEFVNIGAIAGSDEAGDWSLRQAENPRRARSFGPAESLNALFAFLNDVGRRVDNFVSMPEEWPYTSDEEISEAWLNDLHLRHRNIIQLSPPTPIVADSAEEALGHVFEHLISDGASGRREYATRRNLLAELRTSYRKASIRPELIQERVPLLTGPFHAQMDFVVGNGSAVQLAQTWSFEIQSYLEVDKEVKAWGFTMKSLRARGGQIGGDHPSTVDKDVPLEVVFAPPRTKPQIDVFNEASRVFKEVGAIALPRDEVRDVAENARRRLMDAGLLDQLG